MPHFLVRREGLRKVQATQTQLVCWEDARATDALLAAAAAAVEFLSSVLLLLLLLLSLSSLSFLSILLLLLLLLQLLFLLLLLFSREAAVHNTEVNERDSQRGVIYMDRARRDGKG